MFFVDLNPKQLKNKSDKVKPKAKVESLFFGKQIIIHMSSFIQRANSVRKIRRLKISADWGIESEQVE